MNEIYKMKLHDVFNPENLQLSIIRVPGGWIYESFNDTGMGGYEGSCVFVPYNNEFEVTEKGLDLDQFKRDCEKIDEVK